MWSSACQAGFDHARVRTLPPRSAEALTPPAYNRARAESLPPPATIPGQPLPPPAALAESFLPPSPAHTRAPVESLGRAVQVDPIKPKLKAPGTKRLKLNFDALLSIFKLDLRRYTSAGRQPTIAPLWNRSPRQPPTAPRRSHSRLRPKPAHRWSRSSLQLTTVPPCTPRWWAAEAPPPPPPPPRARGRSAGAYTCPTVSSTCLPFY